MQRFSDPFEVLTTVFGHAAFREAQRDAVDAVIRGRDVLVLMPTGAGKSLCYQVPALVMPGVCVVVSPLIALMHDQVSALKAKGVAAGYLYSGLSSFESEALLEEARSGRLDLLYVSPERLVQRRFDLLSDLPVSFIVIDEAHCLSLWGEDFRPEYAALAELKTRFPATPVMALTATADPPVRRQLTQSVLRDPEVVVTSFRRPNIRYEVRVRRGGFSALVDYCLGPGLGASGIVYCRNRADSEKVAQALSGAGVTALVYHAGMSADARRDVQTRFINEKGVVVVATVAFGMGIDKPDVRFVIHWGPSRSPEAYYQESGRAGRDGAPADAILLLNPADVAKQRKAIEHSSEPVSTRARALERFEAMLGYCETARCREVALLAYLGETAEPCGACDNCRRRNAGALDLTDLMRRYLDEQSVREEAAIGGVAPESILQSLRAACPTVETGHWDAALRQLTLWRALEPVAAGGFRAGATPAPEAGLVRYYEWPALDRSFTTANAQEAERVSRFADVLREEGLDAAKLPKRLILEALRASPRQRGDLAALRRYTKVLDAETEQRFLRAALKAGRAAS